MRKKNNLLKKIKKYLKSKKIFILYQKLQRNYYAIIYRTSSRYILQLANTTEFNRHVDLFTYAQEYFTNESNVHKID